MRTIFGERLTGAIALVVLVGALVAIDERLRNEVSVRFAGPQAASELVDAGVQARGVAWVAFDAVRDQSLEHAPLTIFALSAAVLLFFMLRT